MILAVKLLAVSMIGTVVGVIAPIVATAADSPIAGTIVQGTAATISVGALAYMAKLLARGELVARNPEKVERQLLALTTEVAELVRVSHEREARLWGILEHEKGQRR